MGEEEKGAKKRGIVRRILKWIGLGLLSILLIAGLIFQAPWKVITLLLIILLACTVLPKPARKWFWLSAAVIVIALIIWVFLPDDNGDWRPYKYNFDEELAALEAKYAIPDEENAATIYNKLLESFEANELDPASLGTDVCNSIYPSPWLSKDYPEAVAWVKGHQSTIETLIEASKMERCMFRIHDPENFEKHIDRDAAIRSWAYLLVIAANNDFAEGRTAQALEKSKTLLTIADHLYQQPTMIDMLVGSAIESLAIAQFKRLTVTGNATEQYLSNIEDAMSKIKHDWSSDFLKMLESDKLSTRREFSKYYEINTKGKIRLSRDPWAEMRACYKDQLESDQFEGQLYKELRNKLKSLVYLTYLQKKRIKAQTILHWFLLPSTPQKSAEIIDAAYERYHAMAESDFNWEKEPKEAPIPVTPLITMRSRFNQRQTIELLAGMSEKIYYSLHDIYLRTSADQKGSQIIIALKRYKNDNGHWPKTLDDIKNLVPGEILVDPINGDSFVYKLTEDNFTLYSTGKNAIDEAGQYGSKWDPNTYEHTVKKDDRVIWPPRSRKTQEEKADVEQQ